MNHVHVLGSVLSYDFGVCSLSGKLEEGDTGALVLQLFCKCKCILSNFSLQKKNRETAEISRKISTTILILKTTTTSKLTLLIINNLRKLF